MNPAVTRLSKLILPLMIAGGALYLPENLRLIFLFIPAALYSVFFSLKGALFGVLISGAAVVLGHFFMEPIAPIYLYGSVAGYAAGAAWIAVYSAGFEKRLQALDAALHAVTLENRRIKEEGSQYRAMFESIPNGFSYQKVLYDNNGTPADFVFLYVNQAFEQMTGLSRKDLLDRKVTVAMPGVTDPFYDWLGCYEKAMRSGRPVRVETYYQSLTQTYLITIHSPKFGYFTALFHDITGIREEGSDYKKLMEQSKDIIVRFDKNFNCLYVNYETAHRNKRPIELIFGNLQKTRIPAEVRILWEDAIRQAFRSKKERTVELKVQIARGMRYYECRLVPEFSQEGYVDSVLSICRDITAQRTVEENMKQGLDKLKELENIINASPIVVFLWHADQAWTVEFISQNVEQFGFSQQDYLDGKTTFLQRIHPEDVERVQEELTECLNVGAEEFIQEFRIQNAQSEERLVKVEYWMRRDAQGKVTHFQGMITDVTNMIKMPQSLLDSEEQTRILINETREISFMLDLQGMFLSISREGEELLGYTREAIRYKQFLDLVPPDQKEQGRRILAEMTAGDLKEKEFMLSITDQQGHRLPMKLKMKEVMENGHLGISVRGRDISERIQAADQVRYLSHHDKLTGLYNRSYFEEELVRMEGSIPLPLSIIVGDVDGLKLTNDAFGHKEGDRILKAIAEVLKGSARIQDSIFRLGGDEFAILLPEADDREANQICLRIRHLCSQVKDLLVQPSIALGAATLTHAGSLEGLVREAEDKMNRSKLMESRSIRSTIIASLQKTLEERTYETKKHAERMQRLAEKLGRRLSLSDSEMDELSLLCVLHDIGKIGIPDNILMKTGRLTADEWDIMKKHTEIGCNIAAASPDLKSISAGILAHHEHWDGSGYPNRLSGADIPLIARVISVIDAYDAMTNDRPYHKAVSQIAAVIEIDRCAGTQFDPAVVDAFKKEVLS